MNHKKENYGNNLEFLYEALLGKGILHDEKFRELAFLLFSQDIDEIIKGLEGSC